MHAIDYGPHLPGYFAADSAAVIDLPIYFGSYSNTIVQLAAAAPSNESWSPLSYLARRTSSASTYLRTFAH